MSGGRLNRWELTVAGAVTALGAFLALKGAGYQIGTLRHMGPGFFPVAVGVALAALGLAIVAEVRTSSAPPPDLPLRPMALIVAGLIVFAVLVGRAGLIPATLALVLISAFADRAMTPLRALISALGIALVGYLVFVLGFRLPLHPFWW